MDNEIDSRTFSVIGLYDEQEKGQGCIELEAWLGEDSGDAFLGLTEGRRVWIIFAIPLRSKVNTTNLSKLKLNGKRIGMLASRTRYRINPVEICLARVSKVDSHIIWLTDVPKNIPDGSPVLDIKPFSVQTDKLKKLKKPKIAGNSPADSEQEELFSPNGSRQNFEKTASQSDASEEDSPKNIQKTKPEKKIKQHDPEFTDPSNSDNENNNENGKNEVNTQNSSSSSSSESKEKSKEKIAPKKTKSEKSSLSSSFVSSTASKSESSTSKKKLKFSGEKPEIILPDDSKSAEKKSEDSVSKPKKLKSQSLDSEDKKNKTEKKVPSGEDKKSPTRNRSKSAAHLTQSDILKENLAKNSRKSEDKDKKKFGTFQLLKKRLFGKKNNEGSEPTFVSDDRSVVYAKNVEELPADCKKLVKAAKITPEDCEEHFQVLLNILHFKTKLSFRTSAEISVSSISESSSEEDFASESVNKTHSAITSESKEDSQSDSEKERERERLKKEKAERKEQRIIEKEKARQKRKKAEKKKKQRENDIPARVYDEDELKLFYDDPKKIYKIAGLAGKGGFGRVYKATIKNSEDKIAIKKMPHVSAKEKRRNYEEITYLHNCRHPNIVIYYKSYIVKDELWVITEFMEGGTLSEAVKGYDFQDTQIAYIAHEILGALEYLHGQGFVHRDLKSANIMMTTSGDIKLIDFGLCINMNDNITRTHMAGSPYWMPPEMIHRKSYGYPGVDELDIWSFAICLLELANGHPPNKNNSIYALFSSAVHGHKEPLDQPAKWQDDFKDFLQKCLVLEPEERATIAELKKHPFLQKSSTKKSMEKVLTYIFMQTAINMATFG